MATYVNDLRLKEIATGDESGTWGTSTNTNLELIAEAFSYATEASFSSDADATTTIADGATDPARSLYFKVTSGASLTATRTLTIAPNTVSKVWIIENATSGSQSINISQGSGANVTIPNGEVKVIYSDGAGSGAAVVDAFANLKVTDAAQTNITSVGTLTGFTSTGIDDNATSTAITIDSNENLGIGTASPVNNGTGSQGLTINGTGNYQNLSLQVNGTTQFTINTNGTSGTFINQVTADPMMFYTSDTEAMRIDASGNVGINTSSPTSYANSQTTLVIQDTGSPAIAWSDTGQTRDWFAIAQGSGLHFIYADGGGSGSASNVTSSIILDNSGKVGIGTDSPSTALEVNNASAGDTVATFEGDYSASGDVKLASFERNGGAVAAAVTYADAATAMEFGTTTSHPLILATGDTERWRIDTSGHFTGVEDSKIIQTIASGGGNFLEVTHSGNEAWSMAVQSGSGAADYLDIGINGGTRSVLIHESGGISFNGDTGSANHLDDYEEGTFTPTFSSSNSTATGLYQKVGNTVTVFIKVVSTGGLPTSTSQVQIGNLPFTSASNHVSAGPIYIGPSNVSSAVGGGGQISTIMLSSETVIRLVVVDNTTLGYLIWGELEVSSNNVVTAFATHTYTV